jgi:hypothetical protein
VTQPSSAPEQSSSGKIVLLLIVGIPVAVILLSTAFYYLSESRSIEFDTVNKGTLIVPPVNFSAFEIASLKGNAYDYTTPAPKWTFVVFGGLDCTGDCEKMLYLSRQSNTALGKKMNRVRRFYVTYEGGISPELAEKIGQDYQHLSVLSMSRESVQKLFAETDIDPYQPNRFFVVDERGWLMMHYTADSLDKDTLNMLGKNVLKDMRRLLK